MHRCNIGCWESKEEVDKNSRFFYYIAEFKFFGFPKVTVQKGANILYDFSKTQRDIINKKHSWEFRARASEVYDFAAT